jgi:hypothetical protein
VGFHVWADAMGTAAIMARIASQAIQAVLPDLPRLLHEKIDILLPPFFSLKNQFTAQP